MPEHIPTIENMLKEKNLTEGSIVAMLEGLESRYPGLRFTLNYGRQPGYGDQFGKHIVDIEIKTPSRL